jgi:hypothetical protein
MSFYPFRSIAANILFKEAISFNHFFITISFSTANSKYIHRWVRGVSMMLKSCCWWGVVLTVLCLSGTFHFHRDLTRWRATDCRPMLKAYSIYSCRFTTFGTDRYRTVLVVHLINPSTYLADLGWWGGWFRKSLPLYRVPFGFGAPLLVPAVPLNR